MSKHLGIDTSNYTTSIALYESEEHSIVHSRELLNIKIGDRGLRQSNAVFQHVQKLPKILNEVVKNKDIKLSSVGVSSYPRDDKQSYMPCFTVGTSTAKCLAQVCQIPCYEFSHQAGHIAAALFSANRLDLLNKKFIAFHISGGTTEAVLVTPDPQKVIRTTIIAKSLDLKAGQLIDRVGVELGLQFPCGPQLDVLSKVSKKKFKLTPCLKNLDCCLSGAENLCVQMIKSGNSKNDVALFCIEFIAQTLYEMCDKIIKRFGKLPILFAGGVASNSIIQSRFSREFGVIFATPEFSSDNAAGIAILSSEVMKCQSSTY